MGDAGFCGASVTVSDNAPSSPTHGDMWWESDTGDLKIYYDESETGAGLEHSGYLQTVQTQWLVSQLLLQQTLRQETLVGL